jgi:tetratricopeptide (TPR) repeat protein
MSLLMKALEKAAKDRGNARAEPVSRTGTAGPAAAPEADFTLEPLAADTPVLQPKSERQPLSGSTAPLREQAKAATVIQAGQGRAGGIGLYLRTHPIIVLGILAGFFLVGFGIYVYLQIANPGLFIRKPPAPQALPPLAQAPSQAAPPAPAVQPPLPTASVIQSAPGPAPSEPAAGSSPRSRAAQGDTAGRADSAAPRSTIVVSRTSAAPTVPPLLTEAYAALDAGRLDVAQRLYNQLLRAEPKNIDALLGLAAIATQEGKTEEATKDYMRILEFDPRHALAQSGLIAILGRADPLAAETRLKQLIAREPSPFLYFTLGNLYADQSLWAQAQQAYFQAHHLEPANPDYAYNLAVGLEHLSQIRLALGFYRRAVELASAKGRANFSLPQARERITQLASRVE